MTEPVIKVDIKLSVFSGIKNDNFSGRTFDKSFKIPIKGDSAS